MLGKGQLTRELKLGEANHDRMSKNYVHARKHISQRELFTTKGGGNHYGMLLKFDQS
jgi:hypothetical protein